MSLRFPLLVLLAIVTLLAEVTVSNEDRLPYPKTQPSIEAQENQFEHPQLQRPDLG
jgi:hypothetical protein